MASEVFFTSNPAEYDRLEGAYVTELPPAGHIEGVDLGTALMAGACVRGPATIQTITSYPRFLEIYGGRDYGSGGAMKGKIWGALQNKKFGRLVIKRVIAVDAALATKNLLATATPIVRVDATSKGAWGNVVKVAVEDATDGDATHFNLRVDLNGAQRLYKNINTASTSDNTLDVLGDDLGNWIVVTKVANGRPDNLALTVLASGADGTAVNGDYTAAVTALANYQASGVVLVVEKAPTQSTLHATIVTLAAAATDKRFLVWSGDSANSPSTEITAQAAQITTRSDRILWCYNAPKTTDPETATKFEYGPHVQLASILSQIAIGDHAGSHETEPLNAGIVELAHEDDLTREDLVALKEAGISTLEKLPGAFLFRSVVTTDLTPGLEEEARRRQADFLQLSASNRLRFFVKGKNTVERRVEMGSELIAFSRELEGPEGIIEAFTVDQISPNTESQRARGQERIRWNVKLIGHMLSVILETQIGVGTVIVQ